MKKRKLIQQRWVIVGVVGMVILVVLAALYLWQQENIKAAANARKYTQQELEQRLSESRETVQQTLEQYPEITVRDLNEDERKALRSGEISTEELIEILTQPAGIGNTRPGESGSPAATAPAAEPAPPQQGTAPDPTAAPAPTEPPKQTYIPHDPTAEELYEQQLSELVARVYVLREQFVSRLDSLFAQAKAEYAAMPKSEKTKSKLLSWAGGYVSQASALEAECDAEMDAILAEMKALIKANNGDPSITKTMAYSYAEQKSIQKSIYIQELEKRGIM